MKEMYDDWMMWPAHVLYFSTILRMSIHSLCYFIFLYLYFLYVGKFLLSYDWFLVLSPLEAAEFSVIGSCSQRNLDIQTFLTVSLWHWRKAKNMKTVNEVLLPLFSAFQLQLVVSHQQSKTQFTVNQHRQTQTVSQWQDVCCSATIRTNSEQKSHNAVWFYCSCRDLCNLQGAPCPLVLCRTSAAWLRSGIFHQFSIIHRNAPPSLRCHGAAAAWLIWSLESQSCRHTATTHRPQPTLQDLLTQQDSSSRPPSDPYTSLDLSLKQY